jgi:nucleotide-binding universal stress UspA family protein
MSGRIVVGVDGSEEARHALDWAMSEAEVRGANVEVVHAYSAPWEYWAAPVPMAPVPMAGVENVQRELLEKEVESVQQNHTGVSTEHGSAPSLVDSVS